MLIFYSGNRRTLVDNASTVMLQISQILVLSFMIYGRICCCWRRCCSQCSAVQPSLLLLVSLLWLLSLLLLAFTLLSLGSFYCSHLMHVPSAQLFCVPSVVCARCCGWLAFCFSVQVVFDFLLLLRSCCSLNPFCSYCFWRIFCCRRSFCCWGSTVVPIPGVPALLISLLFVASLLWLSPLSVISIHVVVGVLLLLRPYCCWYPFCFLVFPPLLARVLSLAFMLL